jgi:hypothetical protein
MSFKEQERVTREFLSAVESRISIYFPELKVVFGGRGTESHINVRRDGRACRIVCHPPSRGTKYTEILYRVFLWEGRKRIADGQTEDADEFLSCVTDWVGERLPLDALYERFGFIDRTRRSLRTLADHIDRAQTEAGSDILTTIAEDEIRVQLWVYGDRRSCQLVPVEGSEHVQCDFLSEGTVLANADLCDSDAAARGVNLWLDQGSPLEKLSSEITNLMLTDFAEEFERGDVALWNWLKYIKLTRDDDYFANYLPILERLFEKPEVNRFFLFASVGRICFSRCSHYPFATAGMPIISHAPSEFVIEYNGEKFEAEADEVVSFVTKRLAQITEPPFVGCADDVLLEPVNACLAEQGSSLRVARISHMQWSRISVRRGDRTCDLGIFEPADTPYAIYFRAGIRHLSLGYYKTLTGLTEALHMWLEQGCKLEDLAAVADNFTDSSHWPPDISATDSSR